MTNTTDNTVRNQFLSPVQIALDAASCSRQCPDVTDLDHLISGILRVLGHHPSGRGWVQHIQMAWDSHFTVNSFFKALRSQRRLDLVLEVDGHVTEQANRQCFDLALDPLSEHRELDGFAAFASDGHYEAASPHTPPVDDEVQPQGFFYSNNLRTHTLSLLDIARPERKKEHDIHVLKRLVARQLRMNQPKGVKVIHVYDRAGIDYLQWHNWRRMGIYVISREKENSTAETLGVKTWDRADPRNAGVLNDELIGVFAGVLMRRVTYLDPATGHVYRFITSEMTLPPGLIAFLYKVRWDIEKAFDQKQTKLRVIRTWATTPIAKCQQAHFVCLAHNLLLMLERHIAQSENIHDEKVAAKREARRDELEQAILQAGRTVNPLVLQCQRATQRSLQFIRWLQYCLEHPRPWFADIERLRPYMLAYIS